MPELPEVETIVRRYRSKLIGRRLTGFTSRWPKNVSPSPATIRRRLRGRAITGVGRRGKFIVIDLDAGGHLLIHLRMSGSLAWAADYDREPPHVRAVWRFSDGNALWFVDARKFGKISLVDDLAEATAHLGIEPLERGFTRARLSRELKRRSRQIKPLLLDQSVVAGLGNIYVDEALFAAGVHPLTPANQIDERRTAALHRSIKNTLRKAIRHNGTTFDRAYAGGGMQDYLRVYGRTGEPCGRCGAPIEALRVAQRGTHICPCCQPNP